MSSIAIPLFPLSTVLYPGGALSLQVFEVRYLDMIKKALAGNRQFGVVALTAGEEVRRPGTLESFAQTGTMATIASWSTPRMGLMEVRCEGFGRFRVVSSALQKNGLWTAEVDLIAPDQPCAVPSELENCAQVLRAAIARFDEQGVPATELPFRAPYRMDDCGWVANRWCELLPIPTIQKERLLGLDSPLLRLELVQDLLDEYGWLA